jgi:hypothetical protein
LALQAAVFSGDSLRRSYAQVGVRRKQQMRWRRYHHLRTISWTSKMNIYAIEILLEGKVHVKATSSEQADRILNNTCSNTIFGEDGGWFSDVPDAFRQRVTFSSKFSLVGPIEGASFVEVSRTIVHAAQKRWSRHWQGLRWPYSSLTTDHEQVPVYSTVIDMTTTAFVRAASVEAANSVLTRMKGLEAALQADRSRWFAIDALGEGNWDLPVALSTALYLLPKANDRLLSQSWPDAPYKGPKFITLADGFL